MSSIFFKAPPDFYAACERCTDAIREGQIAAEIEAQIICLECYETLSEGEF